MRFASLSACSGVALSLLCLTPREARAADPSGAGEGAAAPSPSSSAESSSWTLALGSEIALSVTDVRESHTPDVVAVAGASLVGLSALARYRAFDAVSLGARAGWSTELGTRGYASSSGESGSSDRNSMQLAIEGRYQPGGHGGYAALRGGAAAITDGFDGHSLTQWGPLGGLAFGYDLRVAGSFAIGLELQGSLIGFSEEGARYSENGETRALYVYGMSSWLGLGLVGSLGI